MLVVAMMVGVVILLRFAKIRDSVSVVASAKQRNRVLDAVGKWSIYAVLAALGIYTLYASWLTLLKLAIGIAAVGSDHSPGSTSCWAASSSARSACSSAASWCSCTARRSLMTLLSFQDSRGLTPFPASGLFSTYWYHILINDATQQALRDSIVVSLKLSALVCIITAVLSLMLGMAFRERFRGSTPLFYLVLLSLMTPGPAALARHDAPDVVPRAGRRHLHDGARRPGRVGTAVRVPRHAGLQPLRREGGRGGARSRRERDAHVPRGHAADRLGRRVRRRAVRVHARVERVRAHLPRDRPRSRRCRRSSTRS